jgi:chromosome segregation ATPase
MRNDDLTDNQADPNDDDMATQPTITSVFRLLQEVRNGQTTLDSRIQGLESALDAFKASVDSRFEGLDSRLDAFESRVNSRFEGLESRLDALESRLGALESRLDALESRLDAFESSVNSRFEALESRLTKDFAGVNARFAEMNTELLKLSDKLSDRINRSRLHAEADIEDITRRLRKLESNALETAEDRTT